MGSVACRHHLGLNLDKVHPRSLGPARCVDRRRIEHQSSWYHKALALYLLCLSPIVQAATFTLSVAPSRVDETGSTVTATVTLAPTPGFVLSDVNGVEATVSTSDVTASAGVDYVATSQKVTFTVTDPTVTVPIRILNDGLPEESETFNVTLTNTGGDPRVCPAGFPACDTRAVPDEVSVSPGSSPMVVTITDDDPQIPTPPPATFTLSVAPSPVAETGRPVTATVTLIPGAGFVLRDANGVTATVSTSDGTARAGVDYVATSQPVTFSGTDPTQTVTIPILNDDVAEEGETFNVALTNAGGGPPQVCPQTDPTCTGPTGDPVLSRSNTTVVTITDGDQPPPPPLPLSDDPCFGVRCLNTIPGLTPNQISTATAIDTFCIRAAGDLGARCRALFQLPDAQARNALAQLTADTIAAQGTMAVETSTSQFLNIANRLAELRAGTRGMSLNGLTLVTQRGALSGHLLETSFEQAATASGAGREELLRESRLGVFVNGVGGFGNRDRTDDEAGFDFKSYGVTAGVDYRFTDNFILGLAFGYSANESDFDRGRGKLDQDAYNLSVYQNYYVGDLYIDAMASYGWNDYVSERQISYAETSDVIARRAEADPGGRSYLLSGGSGYTFRAGGVSFGPNGRLTYVKANFDGFTERGAGGLNLQFDDQDIRTLTLLLGGETSYAINTQGWGSFLPHVRIEWGHELEDNARAIRARFVDDPTRTTFSLRTEDPDRDFFNLTVGVTAELPHGRHAFIQYETQLGRADFTHDQFTAGLRLDF